MPRIRITDEYSLVKRKGSSYWYLEWRAGGQKVRRTTGTASLEDARVCARGLILAGEDLRDEDPAEINVLEVIDRYVEQRGKGLPSSDTVRRARTLWAQFWADDSVSDVTVAKQERFVLWLREKGYSDGYVRRVLGVGKSALNRAWKRGEVRQVPFVELPPVGEAYPHFATRTQLVKMLNTPMPNHIWAYCLVRLCTGCRGDAALDLQAFQIDRESRLVRLNPTGRAQTKKYRPVVPLTDALRRYLDEAKPEAHVVHWHGRKVGSIKTTWRKLRQAAGLPAWFAPKVLRHSVATELRRRGVPNWEVSGQLGHKRAGTSEIYAKFDPAYLGKARSALDAWLADLARDVPRLRGVTSGSVVDQAVIFVSTGSLGIAGFQVVGGTGIEPVKFQFFSPLGREVTRSGVFSGPRENSESSY